MEEVDSCLVQDRTEVERSSTSFNFTARSFTASMADVNAGEASWLWARKDKR
jgi:hypothetical protein